MRQINVKELAEVLESLRGATFTTIMARTKPDFVGGKKSPVANVYKIAGVNGVINWSYGNAVNNERTRENKPLNHSGNVEFFTPEPRKWGVRLTDGRGRLLPTVEHKGNKYLELKVQKSLSYGYFDQDGNKVDNEVVAPYLRQKVEGRRQEVDRPVILRDYKLENIKAIRLFGEIYIVS
jgi:hypothetical protein